MEVLSKPRIRFHRLRQVAVTLVKIRPVHRGTMERQDTELIFSEDEFERICRADSMMPTNSMIQMWNTNNSFSSGTISATSTTTISADRGLEAENAPVLQLDNGSQFQHVQQMQQPGQAVVHQEIVQDMTTAYVVNEDYGGVGDASVRPAFDQQWTLDPSFGQSSGLIMVPPDDVLPSHVGIGTMPEESVDSSQVAAALSLQPWRGSHDFERIVPTNNKDKNKWCYSEDKNKLYVTPNVAVPVGIQLSEPLVKATLRITPVFQQSQHFTEPVERCHNCIRRSSDDPEVKEYICQVDGENAEYSIINSRHVVTLPLQQPPPGENLTTVLIKIMCLTSCVGGPNRKPFALVFDLIHRGKIIGRQVLDVKCCKCPSRDMANDEKGTGGQRGGRSTNYTDQEQQKCAKVRKLALEVEVGSKKRKLPNIKQEPGSDRQFVYLKVPVEFQDKVKEYINGLVLLSQTQSQDLYLP
ncbi:cellular tumor antigen p53-like isoform X6 [Oratosquilla oratoria]|uniref:cellular tumor antigen p53-like isoform X6 n=1 Tax=Oratosquilla oratoria TaxID=337810 RepID=UPI003F75E4D8